MCAAKSLEKRELLKKYISVIVTEAKKMKFPNSKNCSTKSEEENFCFSKLQKLLESVEYLKR